MKIISWNCRGKFREKFKHIMDEDADIFVIQECENPKKYKNHFSEFYQNYVWYGETENKGLCVFAKPHISLKQNSWDTYCLRHFISVNVNQSFDLLAVWACKPYIEEYCIYQSININKYNSKTVIIGDFNSNAIWDKDHGKRNHSVVVNQLAEIGLHSAYHYSTQEKHGEEKQHTFYLYKHLDKKYHIDYCFLNTDLLTDFQILPIKKWLSISDHLPIKVSIKNGD